MSTRVEIRKMSNILTQNGGFSQINGMEFRDYMMKHGKDILDHLYNVHESQRRDGSGFIEAKVIRTTSIRSNPYSLHFDFDIHRNVIDSRCSCVSGVNAKCKHGAALYFFINCSSFSKTWWYFLYC